MLLILHRNNNVELAGLQSHCNPPADSGACFLHLSLHVAQSRFATREGKWALFCVLKAYAAYDEEVNYCQGMNFLAGLLLTYLSSQSAAFGILVVLMQERGLREMYKTNLSVLQVGRESRGSFVEGVSDGRSLQLLNNFLLEL